jgi:hypothetical protein
MAISLSTDLGVASVAGNSNSQIGYKSSSVMLKEGKPAEY